MTTPSRPSGCSTRPFADGEHRLPAVDCSSSPQLLNPAADLRVLSRRCLSVAAGHIKQTDFEQWDQQHQNSLVLYRKLQAEAGAYGYYPAIGCLGKGDLLLWLQSDVSYTCATLSPPETACCQLKLGHAGFLDDAAQQMETNLKNYCLEPFWQRVKGYVMAVHHLSPEDTDAVSACGVCNS